MKPDIVTSRQFTDPTVQPNPNWSKVAERVVDGMPMYDNAAIADHDDMFTFTDYWGQLFDDGVAVRGYGFDRVANPLLTQALISNKEDGLFGYLDVTANHGMRITGDGFVMDVNPGQWFQCPGDVRMSIPPNGRVMVVQRVGFNAMIAQGTVEKHGRLKYINGCHDTILCGPIKADYPVINSLHMPNGINQTMHTHPSTRMGFVIDGGADAETPIATHPLRVGTIFFLPTNGRHKFRTDMDAVTTMRLMAFHPDSGGIGPKDENHIMLNRTVVDGKGANQHPDIQTKD